jgi:O-antigen ligase
MGAAVLFTSGTIAVAAILVAIQFSVFARTASGRMFQAMMWMVTAAGVSAIVLSGRTLRLGDLGLQSDAPIEVSNVLSAKLIQTLCILLALALCTALLSKRWWPKLPFDRYLSRGLKPPTDVTLVFLAFFIAFSLVPLAFAANRAFHISLVYPLFIFAALLFWLRHSTVDPVIAVKQSLAVLVMGSIVAAVVVPALALQPGYVGLLPGFNQRLWGITANANTLGAVAMALFLIEVCEPSKRRWFHWILCGSAALALVLSQSKTAFVTALVFSSLLGAWRWDLARQTDRAQRAGVGILIVIVSLCLVASVGVGVLWLLMANDARLASGLLRHLDPRVIADLATGTGRVDIWQYALDLGAASPIFGHGLSAWGIETRLQTGLTGATHAHNQILQVYTRSGLIGLFFFLWFVWLLIRYAARAAGQTRGGSVVILAALMTRAMVEVPIQPNAVLGGEFFAFMVVLVYLLDRGARQQQDDPTRSAGAPTAMRSRMA